MEFGKRCEEHDIHLQFFSTRKENMGLAEVIMKHSELVIAPYGIFGIDGLIGKILLPFGA